MRYCNDPRLSVYVVPLALGQMSVDVMAVPDDVELVVLDVVEVVVLVGVGLVVLDGVWTLVEELLFNQNGRSRISHLSFLPVKNLE